jgi:hypothetical protein
VKPDNSAKPTTNDNRQTGDSTRPMTNTTNNLSNRQRHGTSNNNGQPMTRTTAAQPAIGSERQAAS